MGDGRLSLRHLAWNGEGQDACLGIAIQAEHDEEVAKAAAPVLAVFDGHSLQLRTAPVSLAGYGGSIVALGSGFAVSCPRSQGVAMFDKERFVGLAHLEEACPLARLDDRLWMGGRGDLQALSGKGDRVADGRIGNIRLDNHWIAL